MNMETPKPQIGTWTLTAPDGRTWQADSPIAVVRMEQRERVPADIALVRIMDAVVRPVFSIDQDDYESESEGGRDSAVRLRHSYTDFYRRKNMSVETAEKALKELSRAMQIDPELAWSWHCNIAMVAQDAGAPHKEANERTADFMRRAFDVDTTKPPIRSEPYNTNVNGLPPAGPS